MYLEKHTVLLNIGKVRTTSLVAALLYTAGFCRRSWFRTGKTELFIYFSEPLFLQTKRSGALQEGGIQCPENSP